MKIKRKNILIICLAFLTISTSIFSNQDSKVVAQETLSKPHKPPILTTAAIIEVYDSDNQFQGIVLIERGKAPWGKALPGGKVEYGETVENAIRREMMEEVNLELFDLNQFHVYSDPTRDFRHHSVEVTHFAKAYKLPKAGADAAKAFVVKLEDIPWETLAFDHAKILKDYLEWKKGNNEFLIIK
jgi:8-oxo-dGTP diphosphatase